MLIKLQSACESWKWRTANRKSTQVKYCAEWSRIELHWSYTMFDTSRLDQFNHICKHSVHYIFVCIYFFEIDHVSIKWITATMTLKCSHDCVITTFCPLPKAYQCTLGISSVLGRRGQRFVDILLSPDSLICQYSISWRTIWVALLSINNGYRNSFV